MGKNALITGGNSGIGRETARTLAGHDYRVIIASRNEQKSAAAVDEIVSRDVTADIEAMRLNLADLPDIDRFAGELKQRMPKIDVLILNSGLYTHGLRTLENGLEAMIGIMHFGHFRLVQLLRESLNPGGRVVITSSVGHRFGRIDPQSFTDPSRHRLAFRAYAQAKLANLLFARELAKQLKEEKIAVNAFHPGAVNTGIWQELPKSLVRVIELGLVTVEQGADTGIWLAESREAADFSGEYFVNRQIARSSRRSNDPALARELWEITEQKLAELVTAD